MRSASMLSLGNSFAVLLACMTSVLRIAGCDCFDVLYDLFFLPQVQCFILSHFQHVLSMGADFAMFEGFYYCIGT